MKKSFSSDMQERQDSNQRPIINPQSRCRNKTFRPKTILCKIDVPIEVQGNIVRLVPYEGFRFVPALLEVVLIRVCQCLNDESIVK